MKKYMDDNTGATFTEEEVREAYEQFRWEMAEKFETFEDYLEEMCRRGTYKVIEAMEFEEYGDVEYVSPEEYYTDGWSIVGKAEGADGEEYDILLSADKTTYGYSNI